MNATHVCVAYSHPVHACCCVYDYTMRVVSEFGQRTNPQAPCFMEKCTTITTRQEASLRFRQDPQVFGLTDTRVYLRTWHKCYVMCRRTGLVLSSIPLSGNRAYFLLDEEEEGEKDGDLVNVIQVNRAAKRVTVYNGDLKEKKEEREILVESVYENNLDTMHLLKTNNMKQQQRIDGLPKFAFVDPNAKAIIYV
jgi:hypothetical protein